MPPHQSWLPYPPPSDSGERTAVIERDLYHLDQRLGELSGTVTAANGRLHALSERIRQAEYQLDATTTSLVSLQGHTADMADKLPDIESMVRVLRWLTEAVKYVLGLAILAGALAGGQTGEVIKAVFGG